MYPWQQSQLNLLHQAFVRDRLSHAYLLSGVSGLGKTDFAREFSMFLLCINQVHEGNTIACGNCRSCKQFQGNTHPDFLLIEPEEKSKTIKIDQIRTLTETISKTAHAGGYQMAIISPVDALSVAAANALLKTLEEPSGKVIIFLIDNQLHVLPATIVSRCQKIIFNGDDQKCLPWLKEKYPAEKNLALLLKISGDAPLAISHYMNNHFL